MKARLAIMIGGQGRGSNMAALLSSCASGFVPATPLLVIATKDGSPAIERARAHGVKPVIFSPKEPDYADRLLAELQAAKIEVICLAGYLNLLPKEVVAAYRQRILNIHPALLPKFGGKGMYGMHVHEAVLAAGEIESGCTVHFVTENYDEGSIIFQRRVPVLAGDSAEDLALRVLEQEHLAYPEALMQVISSWP